MTIENFVPALWKYTDNNGAPTLGNIYINKEMLYINEDSDTITVDKDGKITNVLHISNSSGYLCVRVKPYKQGMFEDYGLFCVHQIMAFTFIGLPPIDMVNPSVDHKNSRRTDNHIRNLCWLDVRDNRAKRLFGSKESIYTERIGNDCKFKIRDTRLLKSDIKRRDDRLLDEEYFDDCEAFLDKYR